MTRERQEFIGFVVGAVCGLALLIALSTGLVILLTALAIGIWHLPVMTAWLVACAFWTITMTGGVALFGGTDEGIVPAFGFGVAYTLLSSLYLVVTQ